jgi:hypothetical protein
MRTNESEELAIATFDIGSYTLESATKSLSHIDCNNNRFSILMDMSDRHYRSSLVSHSDALPVTESLPEGRRSSVAQPEATSAYTDLNPYSAVSYKDCPTAA